MPRRRHRCPAPGFGRVRGLERRHVGKIGVVVDVQHLVGIDVGIDLGRVVLHFPSANGKHVVHAIGHGAVRAADETAAAARDAVEGAVEGEERARGGIRRERLGRHEVVRVARACGHAPKVCRAVEYGPVRQGGGVQLAKVDVAAAQEAFRDVRVVRMLVLR